MGDPPLVPGRDGGSRCTIGTTGGGGGGILGTDDELDGRGKESRSGRSGGGSKPKKDFIRLFRLLLLLDVEMLSLSKRMAGGSGGGIGGSWGLLCFF